MKAVILAGGSGTRGRPYTEFFPKAMIPVRGRPVIDYVAGYLRRSALVDGITIVADLDGLGGQIRNYFGCDSGITFVQDSQSGTGGDLLHLEGELGGERGFVLWFVDNLCAVDLEGMQETFSRTDSTACIAVRSKRREETGFVIVKDGLVKEFREKPLITLQQPECLGVYILGGGIFERIRANGDKGQINLSFDVLQDLASAGGVSAFDIGDAEWIDVESPVIIDRNRDAVAKIIEQMGL